MKNRKIGMFTAFMLIFAVLMSTPIYAVDNADYSYGYFDENGNVVVVSGEQARKFFLETQKENSESFKFEEVSPDWLDVLGLKERPVSAFNTANPTLNEMSEWGLRNALLGNFNFSFSSQKAPKLASVMENIYTYYPHFFGMGMQSSNGVIMLTISINTSYIAQEFTETVNFPVPGIDLATTNMEKAKAINDAIALHATYDEESFRNPEQWDNTRRTVKGQHALNIYRDKTAVCAGYANAFSLLAFYHGINAPGISGNAGGAHRWNWVLCDETQTYYLVDVTWNDAERNGDTTSSGISYDYFWQSDLTARSYGTFAARRWSKDIDAFIKHVNSAPPASVEIFSGRTKIYDNTTSTNAPLTLWLGGGRATSSSGGIATTNQAQLAAFEQQGTLFFDNARSRQRAWAITQNPTQRPPLNGKNYLSDRSIANVSGGRVTATSSGTAYLWYIQRGDNIGWNDSVLGPITVNVRIAPNNITLSSTDNFSATTGVTGRGTNSGSVKVGESIRLYLNAFHKGKTSTIVSPADTTYTVALAKPTDAAFVRIEGGVPLGKGSTLFDTSALGQGGITVRALSVPGRNKGTPSVRVAMTATCNESGRVARFNLTVNGA
ncbi:MAG: hypothetical protein FWH05_02080 [Oscillospiraceae bacterium]|nr:hypothetical protein [Oscillospiraceae bacterium]